MNENAENYQQSGKHVLEIIAPSCNIKGLSARKDAAKWLSENFYPHIKSVNELETGYELVFENPSSEFLSVIFDVVKQETECCPSFHLAVIIGPGKQFVRYQYYGSKAIKEEMKTAFEAIGVFK